MVRIAITGPFYIGNKLATHVTVTKLAIQDKVEQTGLHVKATQTGHSVKVSKKAVHVNA